MLAPGLALLAALGSLFPSARLVELPRRVVVPSSSQQTGAADASHEDLVARIRNADGEQLGPALQQGFDQMMVEVRAYRGVRARELAEALHDRARASWSAMSLALVCTRTGDPQRATGVLRKALERAPNARDRYELLERLGLALQASGADKAALAPLGSALVRGSANAGVVLGRFALQRGQVTQARAIFRTLLAEDPPQSWALRGWGLCLLPGRPPRSKAAR